MPRQPMVTRAIKEIKVTVLCADVDTGQVFNTECTLPHENYMPDNKLLKIIKKQIEIANSGVKVIEIKEKVIVSGLYGMGEKDFLNHAVPLDPVTRKPLNVLKNE